MVPKNAEGNILIINLYYKTVKVLSSNKGKRSNQTIKVEAGGDWLLVKGNSEPKHSQKNEIRSQENVTVEMFNKQSIEVVKKT